MTKKEIIKEMAKRLNISISKADSSVNTLLDILSEELVMERPIRFVGFGDFKVKKRKERTVLHPITKKPVLSPVTRNVSFTAGTALKAALAGKS